MTSNELKHEVPSRFATFVNRSLILRLLERKDKCLHEIWHLSSLFELLRKNTVTLKQFSVTVSSSYVRV